MEWWAMTIPSPRVSDIMPLTCPKESLTPKKRNFILKRPVYDLLGGQIHEKLRSYTYLYPRESDTSDVYSDADLAAKRADQYAQLGFTAVKFDPVGPYSAFDPRQLNLEALERSEKFVKKIREAVAARHAYTGKRLHLEMIDRPVY